MTRWSFSRSTGLLAILLIGARSLQAEVIPQPAQRSDTIAESEEDVHKPRHGGQFGDADDLYHYEVLLQGDRELVLYVNDEHNHPLDVRGLEGRWTLSPDDPQPVTGTLTPSPDGAYFRAQLPPTQVDPLHVEVAVRKGRFWARMEFYLPHPSS